MQSAGLFIGGFRALVTMLDPPSCGVNQRMGATRREIHPLSSKAMQPLTFDSTYKIPNPQRLIGGNGHSAVPVRSVGNPHNGAGVAGEQVARARRVGGL